MHTHVVYNHLPSPTCKHMWLSWHTVSINAHTHMKDTNQVGADYRSWLSFNVENKLCLVTECQEIKPSTSDKGDSQVNRKGTEPDATLGNS